MVESEKRNPNVSWSAYNASNIDTIKEPNLSALFPLFREPSKSAAMIKHGMGVIKKAIDFLNKGQTLVIAYDQPLFALAKLLQWNYKEYYGEKSFVVMMGPLHIEMAALKTIGDWLTDSGWCSALVEAKIALSGMSESFLHASHVPRTRNKHQVKINFIEHIKHCTPLVALNCSLKLWLAIYNAYLILVYSIGLTYLDESSLR